jgi:hypothetical protein
LSLSDFENGLRFWGLSGNQFSAQVVSTNTFPDLTASSLLITTRTFDAPLLHKYSGERQLKYQLYQMTAHEPISVQPKILDFGPKTVEAGKAFNIQPSGHSAMWLRTQNASSSTYITIDNQKLNLLFGSNGLASTTIPKELTTAPRTAQLQLHDPVTGLTSDTMEFRILPIKEIP